jgi:hypothetical protein
MLFTVTDIFWSFLLFIAAIVVAACFRYANTEQDECEATKRERIFLQVFRAVGILAILVCLAFVIIMLFLTRYYTNWMSNIFPLMALAVVGIGVAALNLKVRPPIIGRGIAKVAVALVIAASLLFVYLNYMPKYSLKDGANMLSSNEEFAQKDVFYPALHSLGEPDGYIARFGDPLYDQFFGANPFYDELHEFHCDSYSYDADGLHVIKGYIIFNPATGAYEYMRTQNQDRSFKPGEWPEFNWNFMEDEDRQHDAVLNLYFREWYFSDSLAAKSNPMLSVSSGEWDANMKEVIYPHNFPEDEARTFLKSIDEEALKTKILEQIKEMDSTVVLQNEDNTAGLAVIHTIDKTIEVFFFDIDIATYQNGEIVLKI